jgi:hypothetical protein
MEFFKDTFSCKPLNEDIDIVNNIKELKIDTKPISKQEIRKAIKSMKNGEAPGLDNITAELLQTDMETYCTNYYTRFGIQSKFQKNGRRASS